MRAVEQARTLARQKVAEMEIKLGGTKLKLAEIESLNSANVKEIVELKAALEASENQWYNTGFANAENSKELVIY